VKAAPPAYYADGQLSPADTTSTSGNYSFSDEFAGTPEATYCLERGGLLKRGGDTGETGRGTTSQ
jgi:hypothetical protein